MENGNSLLEVASVLDITHTFRDDVNTKINELILRFTHNVIKSGCQEKYVSRGANPGEVENNIASGKKAEFVVASVLTRVFRFPKVIPDLGIKDVAKKNWDPDLPYSSLTEGSFPNVHVKSCNETSVKKCGNRLSWVFQFGKDSGGRDKLFTDNPPDLIAFVYLDDWNASTGTIKAILPWWAVRVRLTVPLYTKFGETKRCLYLEHIEYDREELDNFGRLFMRTVWGEERNFKTCLDS